MPIANNNSVRDPLVHVTITCPASLLDLIDAMRGKCPRSEWLRVAAQERLERLKRTKRP